MSQVIYTIDNGIKIQTSVSPDSESVTEWGSTTHRLNPNNDFIIGNVWENSTQKVLKHNFLSRILFDLPKDYARNLKIQLKLNNCQENTIRKTRVFLMERNANTLNMYMADNGGNVGIQGMGRPINDSKKGFFYETPGGQWTSTDTLKTWKGRTNCYHAGPDDPTTPNATLNTSIISATFDKNYADYDIYFNPGNFNKTKNSTLAMNYCLYALPYFSGFGFNKGILFNTAKENVQLIITYQRFVGSLTVKYTSKNIETIRPVEGDKLSSLLNKNYVSRDGYVLKKIYLEHNGKKTELNLDYQFGASDVDGATLVFVWGAKAIQIKYSKDGKLVSGMFLIKIGNNYYIPMIYTDGQWRAAAGGDSS